MSEERVYGVTWHAAIKAKTRAEAIMKAKRLMQSPAYLHVEEVKLPKQHDPKTHCRHGKLWAAFCDYC